MTATADFASKPYATWMETVVKEAFEIDPVSIAMVMRDADGQTYTCYWQVSSDDWAIMVDAMQTDKFLDWLRINKDLVEEALNDEDGGEDGV